MTALAYRHHGSSGFGSHLGEIVLRGAIYRVMWGLPMPVVLVAGLAAGYVVFRARRSWSGRRGRDNTY